MAVAGAVGAALTASACTSATTSVNRSRVQLRASIETALHEDRLAAAVSDAALYERRVPGPESWSLLGRALWRSGDLTASEGFYRRAAAAGGGGGLVGLARSAAARGRVDDAIQLASQAREDPEVTADASRLLAALAWRRGSVDVVGDHLRDAAVTTADAAERRALLSVAAAADRVAAGGGGVPDAGPLAWRGAASRIDLRVGETLELAAEVGDAPVRLRIALDAARSTLTPELVERIGAPIDGAEPDRRWVVVPLRLGSLTAGAVPFAVAPDARHDGVLAFDVLSTLRWVLWPHARVLHLAPTDGPTPSAMDLPLARTHWASIRTPIDLLDAQLLLMPRIGSSVVPAALALTGNNRVSEAGLSRAYEHASAAPAMDDGRASLRLRIGGWSTVTMFDVEPATEGASACPVIAPASLGAPFARSWGLGWRPGRHQLALVESTS